MFKVRILAIALAAIAVSAPPALAGAVCKADKCIDCETVYTDCIAKAKGDAVKETKCQVERQKCLEKCTV